MLSKEVCVCNRQLLKENDSTSKTCKIFALSSCSLTNLSPWTLGALSSTPAELACLDWPSRYDSYDVVMGRQLADFKLNFGFT